MATYDSPYQTDASGVAPRRLTSVTALNQPAPISQPARTSSYTAKLPVAGSSRSMLPPTVPGASFSSFGPSSTLRGIQIAPGTDPRLAQTQTGVDQASQALSGYSGSAISPEASRARSLALSDLEALRGPDRSQIASDTLQRLIADTNPQYEKELQGVGQRAAALGRLGSGVTTSDLGDVAQRRQQAIASEAGRLSSEAAGLTLSDRLQQQQAAQSASSQFTGEDINRAGFDLDTRRAQLSDLAGLENQQYLQGLGAREEIRGERGYQNDLASQATEDQVRQLLLEDQLLGSAFNRDQARLGTLSQGYGGNPAGTLQSGAGYYGGQAGGSMDAAAQYAALLGSLGTKKK